MGQRLEFEGQPVEVLRFRLNGTGRAVGELADAIHMGAEGYAVVKWKCVSVEMDETEKDGIVRTHVADSLLAALIPPAAAIGLFDEANEAAQRAHGQDPLPGMEAQPGVEVKADADGSVLTAAEVADRQGLAARDEGPSLEEAEAWWEEAYPDKRYESLDSSEVIAMLADIPLSRVECVAVIERDFDGDASEEVLDAVAERLGRAKAITTPPHDPVAEALQWVEDDGPWGVAADGMSVPFAVAVEDRDRFTAGVAKIDDPDGLDHLDVLAHEHDAPGWARGVINTRRLHKKASDAPAGQPPHVIGVDPAGTPLEAKLQINEVRARLATVDDRALIDQWRAQEENRGSKARKRVIDACTARLARIDADARPAPQACPGSGKRPINYSDVVTCSECLAPVTVRTDGNVPRHALRRGAAGTPKLVADENGDDLFGDDLPPIPEGDDE